MVDEQQQYKSHKHFEQEQQRKKYFQHVIDAYLQFQECSPLVAIDYDPQSRRTKRTPAIIHFLADVEIATRRTLKSPELYEKWFALIQDQQIEPAVAKRIVSMCSRIYMQRRLAPFHYFRNDTAR